MQQCCRLQGTAWDLTGATKHLDFRAKQSIAIFSAAAAKIRKCLVARQSLDDGRGRSLLNTWIADDAALSSSSAAAAKTATARGTAKIRNRSGVRSSNCNFPSKPPGTVSATTGKENEAHAGDRSMVCVRSIYTYKCTYTYLYIYTHNHAASAGDSTALQRLLNRVRGY